MASSNKTININASTAISYDNEDIVNFAGIGDILTVSRSDGSTFIASGTDQQLGFGFEGGTNDVIDDEGQGLTLWFYQLSGSPPTVNGFGTDLTGHIAIPDGSGQTFSMAPDGQGGTDLTIGGSYGGLVHFAGDPPSTLATQLDPPSPPDPPPPPPPPPQPQPVVAPPMSLSNVQNSTIDISDSSGDAGITNDNNDLVNFSGISDALAFNHSAGSTFVASGTNQNLAVDFAGQDDYIVDQGQGLTLSFFGLTGTAAPFSWLKVDDFRFDLTGRVIVKTDVGQTASMTPDMRGDGTYLTLSGPYGGSVDFEHDPMSSLAAHLVTNV